MSLAKNIQNINQEQKEIDLQEKAEELGLGYVNFLKTKVQISALSLVEKEDSERLRIICFFAVKNKIRIGVVNPEDSDVKGFIQKLKNEGFALNINLISEESFEIAFGFYSEVVEKEVFDEKISTTPHPDPLPEGEGETKAPLPLGEGLGGGVSNKEENNFFEEKKFLKDLYTKALEFGASDLHFEAYEKSVLIKLRIHGELQKFSEISKDLYSKVVMNLKSKSNLILNETHIPQDGKFFIELEDRKIDMRISIIPTGFGEDIVIRILDPLSTKINLEELGFFDFQIETIDKNLAKNQGAILVSGPTGSGKTSTLYSFLKKLNTGKKKIISLEDPVEYHFDGIVQSDVNKKMSFEDGLKACLRHDPDVIMLGEIRTKETAEIAMQASITGHLMLSTIHTNSAIDTIFRLKNFGVKDYLINSSINLILAQRLVKKLCPYCLEEKEFSDSEKNFIKKIDPEIGLKISEMQKGFISKGCEKCRGTGISGREMICEVLEIDDDVRNFLSEGKNFSELKKFLKEEKNFLTLQEIGIAKVLKGKIGFSEILGL